MLTNYHTHTTFCDGINTPEEMVRKAIEKGFKALGFSGHGITPFDMKYCINDISAYITEVNRVKEKYKDKIQVYLGIEEDSYAFCDREKFEYMIGSCHYVRVGENIYPIDISYEELSEILKLFDNNSLKFAEEYYKSFCEYIINRKPDIIGHFDLLTKFEETDNSIFFSDTEYTALAEKYLKYALKSDCIFEVNTGAISRGYRTKPYPNENLLYLLKKEDAKIILSSDCHNKEFLDCNFEETRKYLKDIGFEYLYILYNNSFTKEKFF